jgi:hypothetical protein
MRSEARDSTSPGSPRLALSLGSSALDSAGTAASRLSALVRAAASQGVVLFDLTETVEPRRCWDLAAAAEGSRWAEATVFVPARTASGAAPDGDAATRRVIRFLESTDAARDGGEPAVESPGVRFRDLALAEVEAERAVEEGATWISFPGHLLEARRVQSLVGRLRGAGAEVLVTNPHADGRLDGRWLAEGGLANDGPPRPLGLAELQRAYAPLLPLGFLTEGHRRSLAQAAVAFVQAIDAVPSVRVRDPRQLAELVDPRTYPPLSSEELRRLGDVVPGTRRSTRPAPPPGFK